MKSFATIHGRCYMHSTAKQLQTAQSQVVCHKSVCTCADQLIAEGTFVVTPNTFGAQQVNVVLTNKKGYQKGKPTAFFLLQLDISTLSALGIWHLQVLRCLSST